MIPFRVCDKGDAEYEGSRFFGDPLVPERWAMKEPWSEDCYFFCQYNLADLKGMDTGGLLPDKGMMYFFCNTDSDVPDIKVFYTDKEPDTIYEECNMGFDDEVDYDLFTDYVVRFGEDGCGSILAEEGGDIVLLDYDPLRSETDLFYDIGRVRVLIPRESLEARRFGEARTEVL